MKQGIEAEKRHKDTKDIKDTKDTKKLLQFTKVALYLYAFIFLCLYTSSLDAAQPGHVRAVELENGHIKLWWDLSGSADICEYRIYLQTSQDVWKLLAAVPAHKQWWQSQSKMSGQFAVSAVNKHGIEEKTKKPALNIPYLKVSTNNCMTSFMDDENNIWIGTPGGVKRINADNNQVKVYTVKDGLINNYVQVIIQDSRGYLWFGTREGLSCYTGRVWKTYTMDDGLLSNNVLSIMQDNHKTFWFGTSEGANRYDGKRWTAYAKNEGMAGYAVKDIEKDEKGNIWFATSDGISKYDGKEWTIYSKDSGLASNAILSVYKDKTGRLWFGSNYGGVSIYNGKEWFVYANSDISHTPVRSIIEDTCSNFWFAAGEKVVRFDGCNWESYGIDDGLASYDVLSLSMDKAGRIWAVGTGILNKGCGISRYNKEIWQTWTQGLINPLNLNVRHKIPLTMGTILYSIPILVLLLLAAILFIYKKKVLSAYFNLTMVKSQGLLKKILDDQDSFFAVIYEILPEDRYPLVTLNHLSAMLRVKYQHHGYYLFASLLCKAYYHLQKSINEEKKEKVAEVLNQGFLTRTAEALEHTTHLKWGRQIYSVYNFLAKAWEVENFHQILEIEETIKQTSYLLQENGFIVPDVSEVILRLGDEFFGIIGRYQRARTPKKKMEYLQMAIDLLTELHGRREPLCQLKRAESNEQGIADGRQTINDRIQGGGTKNPSALNLQPYPEMVFLQRILDNWALKLKDYIQISNSRAQIEYQLRNKNLFCSSDGLLVFELTNTGGGPARNIVIELLAGEGYSATPESKKEINLLLPQRSIEVELRIQPVSDGGSSSARDAASTRRASSGRGAVLNHDVIVGILLQFDDIEKSGKQVRISEKLSIFAASQLIHGNVFKELETNPYIIGRALQGNEGSVFVGRDELCKRIKDSLNPGSNTDIITLYGSRKTGKTSVLNHIYSWMNGKGIPVLTNTKGMLDCDTNMFFYNIATDIFHVLKDKNILLKEPIQRDFEVHGASRFRNKFMNMVEKAIGDVSLILMFDEYETIEQGIRQSRLNANIPEYLRSLVQHNKRLSVLFSDIHRIEELNLNHWSPLFDGMSSYQVGLLDIEDAMRLISQPVADYFQYDPLAIEKIVKTTAGHPYFVQLLCHEVVNYRNKTKRNYITRADINCVVNAVIEDNVSLMDIIWKELSLDNQIFLSMMDAILKSNDDSSIKGIENFMVRYNLNLEVKAITTELLKKEIIKEEDGYYGFRMELLSLWINRYKNIQQLSSRASKYSPLWR
ncbi:MAG: two-component regulator propeller domain-containing protein [bacterium]|nr:two-component regulator propeller domain-containing protein [bacterium]